MSETINEALTSEQMNVQTIRRLSCLYVSIFKKDFYIFTLNPNECKTTSCYIFLNVTSCSPAGQSEASHCTVNRLQNKRLD